MSKTARKEVGKKVRFEVFKRDGFVCQYCGAKPPSVLLQLDHIHPVTLGGGNNIDNLLTACQPCNIGKGARSLIAVPASLKEKAEEIKEREAQIIGYQKIVGGMRDRLEAELWRVAEALEPGCSRSGMDRKWLKSIGGFIEKLGVYGALDAVEIALMKYPQRSERTFLYFCGVCWHKIREQANG